MSYVQKVLQPEERLIVEGRLHWVMYLAGLRWLLVGLFLVSIRWTSLFRAAIELMSPDWNPARIRSFCNVAAVPFCVLGLLAIARAKFRQMTTELAVTDRRVIQKVGFISRRTAETNINQVENVEVDQSLFGRMLDCGTVSIHGTGSGLESLGRLAEPLRVHTAITLR